MYLSFEALDPEDAQPLVDWLSSEVWPFHVRERPEPAQIRARLEAGDYTEDTRTFWVLPDETERVGLVRLEDLSDPSPTTDFRVREAYRGKGIGERMVRWAAEYVFTTFPDTPSREGQTRKDNVAMQRVFERCGWVREAYYRVRHPGRRLAERRDHPGSVRSVTGRPVSRTTPAARRTRRARRAVGRRRRGRRF